MLYHDYDALQAAERAKGGIAPEPHIVCCFNAGVWVFDEWTPTVLHIYEQMKVRAAPSLPALPHGMVPPRTHAVVPTPCEIVAEPMSHTRPSSCVQPTPPGSSLAPDDVPGRRSRWSSAHIICTSRQRTARRC